MSYFLVHICVHVYVYIWIYPKWKHDDLLIPSPKKKNEYKKNFFFTMWQAQATQMHKTFSLPFGTTIESSTWIFYQTKQKYCLLWHKRERNGCEKMRIFVCSSLMARACLFMQFGLDCCRIMSWFLDFGHEGVRKLHENCDYLLFLAKKV